MTRGAAIVAFLRGPKGWPENAAEVTAYNVRTPAAKLSAKRIARGTFQITGLEPGKYQFTAAARHLSSGPVDISVTELREYVIPDVTMRELGALDVTVTPTPPIETPWTVQLLRRAATSETLRKLREGRLDEFGTWSTDGLDFGPYVVSIVDQKGAVIHQAPAEIGAGRTVAAIALEHVPVRGTVALGTAPLEGVVQFARSGARIELEVDDRGEFAGMLPDEGTWQVTVTPLSARQRLRYGPVAVHRRAADPFARIDLRLPPGRIRGAVVTPAGKPVGGAEILVLRGSDIVGTVVNGSDGRFEMLGVEDGDVTLTAYTDDNESAPVGYRVSDDPHEVTLVLQDLLGVQGQVIDDHGRPLPGAIIRYITPTDGVREVVANPSGKFSLRMPPGTVVDTVTLARGYAIHVQRFVVTNILRPVIRLTSNSGTVIVGLKSAPPWPVVGSDGATIPLPAFFRPRAPGTAPTEASEAGFILDVEPGEYVICGDRTQQKCITTRVPPAGRVSVDATSLSSQR